MVQTVARNRRCKHASTKIETDVSGTITGFSVLQSAIEEHHHIRPHRMAIGFYNLASGKVVRSHRVEIDVEGVSTQVNELVGLARPDLILLNDDDLAYAKIRLDDRSWKTAIEHLSEIEDPLARALIWGAAWDATRDGETNPREFIQLVLNNIETESESTTILTLLRQLVTTGSLYVAAAHREKALEQIADGLLNLARNADAGSDLQLQFTKFFPQFARTQSQLDALQNILDGKEKLAGLTIDADLKWELLTGLVVGGRATAADIDAALAADNTANGQKAAALAKAALPQAAAKAAAWNQQVNTDELSNALVSNASMGFGRVLDSTLLEPFVERYFADALKIWNSKTYKIAEYLLVNLYPIQLASEGLAQTTRDWLEKTDLSDKAALKRMVVENLAALERALKAQHKDLEG